VSDETNQILEKLKQQGKITPLQFLLTVMNNPKVTASVRVDAAKAALPYMHSKQPTSVNTTVEEVTQIPPYLPKRF